MTKPSQTRMKAIHRRRRTFALIAVILVAASGVALFIWQPWAVDAADAPSLATPSPTPSATPTPTPSGPDWTGVDESDGDGTVTVLACTQEQLELVPVTDQSAYTADEQVGMSFTLTNTSDASCELNVGTSQQRYLITSGNETLYDSTLCNPADGVDQLVTIPSGETWSTAENPIEWDRVQRTAESCDAEPVAATAGGASYNLSVALSGIAAERATTFTLD